MYVTLGGICSLTVTSIVAMIGHTRHDLDIVAMIGHTRHDPDIVAVIGRTCHDLGYSLDRQHSFHTLVYAIRYPDITSIRSVNVHVADLKVIGFRIKTMQMCRSMQEIGLYTRVSVWFDRRWDVTRCLPICLPAHAWCVLTATSSWHVTLIW